MRVMHSMELTDEEKLDRSMPYPELVKGPDFPGCLRISLSERELEKLDLDPAEAEVGGMVHGHFIARITSVNASQNSDGKHCCCIEMQIENLNIESEDEENEADEDEEDEQRPPRRLKDIY